MGEEHNALIAMQTLIEHGWISLRQTAILLGYNELRGIYARQRGRNAIPTVRIGGIIRVNAEDIVNTLVNCPVEKRAEYQVLLSMYRTGLKKQAREKDDA